MEANRASPSRTDRYLTRVETHLRALKSDATRRDFISREIDKWEERYARFVESAGESHRGGDGSGQPTAFDFAETLIALGAMQSRYAERQPEVRHVRLQRA
ncbi:MAG TPA: hypothetical protein VFK79_17985 [Xanthobacteraceae bacterium]|nr:hypothetical protein [Xanthobacteraceae bacterium]